MDLTDTMVRHYKRKSNRSSYSQDALSSALTDVKNGILTVYAASNKYHIPRATIIKRLGYPSHVPVNLGRFRPVFSDDLEAELVMHAVGLQQRFYGLSLSDLCYLAYQFAEANKLDHPFSHIEKREGVDWARNFMKRYPELSLRKPEATSTARLSCSIGYRLGSSSTY